MGGAAGATHARWVSDTPVPGSWYLIVTRLADPYAMHRSKGAVGLATMAIIGCIAGWMAGR